MKLQCLTLRLYALDGHDARCGRHPYEVHTSLGRAQGNVEIEPHARMLLVKGQHRDCRSSLDEPPSPKGPGASALKLIVIIPQAPEMFLSL